MRELNFKAVAVPTIILLIICCVSGGLLAVSNQLTSPKIAQIEEDNAKAAMNDVLPADKYQETKQDNFYIAYKGDQAVGYVADCTQQGYGGDVEIMVGIDDKGSITQINVVDCSNETPGLGQNVNTDDFKNQFKGLSGEIVFGENVDAITGATITSTAVKNAVNEALKMYGKEVG